MLIQIKCGSATYNNATEYYLSLNKQQSLKRQSQKRIYLNVPYNEKDEAKKWSEMGISKKSWYILKTIKIKN